MTLDFTITRTPVGPIGLYGLEDRLVGLTLDGEHGADHPVERHLAHHLGAVATRPAPDAAGAASRLARYFGGELANGYAFRLPAERWLAVARWAELERKCCPFFAVELSAAPDRGPVWLRITGAAGVKAFMKEEMGL